MKNNSQIDHHISDGVSTITLNNPKNFNAFDDILMEELINTLKSIEKNTEIRVVILRSEGKHFSAGANLQWMQKMAGFSLEENKKDARKLTELLKRLSNLSKPTLALVQGRAMAGAIGLLACCDIVLAASDAAFCFSEVKLGLIPATIAPYIIRSIGYAKTRAYFLTAEVINVKQACRMGLVHQYCAPEELPFLAQDYTKQLLKRAPGALTAAKKLVNDIVPIPETLIEKTADLLADIRNAPEAKEGIEAFLEKREPKW